MVVVSRPLIAPNSKTTNKWQQQPMMMPKMNFHEFSSHAVNLINLLFICFELSFALHICPLCRIIWANEQKHGNYVQLINQDDFWRRCLCLRIVPSRRPMQRGKCVTFFKHRTHQSAINRRIEAKSEATTTANIRFNLSIDFRRAYASNTKPLNSILLFQVNFSKLWFD